MVAVRQGDIFWLNLGRPRGSEPGYRRPHVIIQNNALNTSRIATVITCPITSNLRLGEAYGNVRLYKGEANLPRASVVNVSQPMTVDQAILGEKIGTLSSARVTEIVQGIWSVLEPTP